jgi:hypothetical protein
MQKIDWQVQFRHACLFLGGAVGSACSFLGDVESKPRLLKRAATELGGGFVGDGLCGQEIGLETGGVGC